MNRIYRSSVAMLAVGATVLAVGIMPASAKSKSNPTLKNSLTIAAAQSGTTGAALAIGGSSFDQPLVAAAITQFNAAGANNSGWITTYGSKNSLCGRELALGYLGSSPATLSNSSGCPTIPTDGYGAIGFSDISLDNETVAAPLDSALYPSGKSAADYVQVPVTIGGIAIIFKIGFASDANAICQTNFTKNGLKLDGKTIGQIFKGTVTNWNAAAIAATNKSLQIKGAKGTTPYNCLAHLTTQTITLEDRTAGSGTTFMFSTYLQKVDATEFPNPLSTLPTVTGMVQSSSSALLSAAVGSTDGSIGYVESSYAIIANAATPGTLNVAVVKNASGKYVKCTTATIGAAAKKGLAVIGTNFAADQASHYALVNEPGKTSYPMVGVSWAIVRKAQTNQYQAKAIVQFLEFLTHTGTAYGQSNAAALSYVALPAALQALAETKLGTVTYPTGVGAATAFALTTAN